MKKIESIVVVGGLLAALGFIGFVGLSGYESVVAPKTTMGLSAAPITVIPDGPFSYKGPGALSLMTDDAEGLEKGTRLSVVFQAYNKGFPEGTLMAKYEITEDPVVVPEHGTRPDWIIKRVPVRLLSGDSVPIGNRILDITVEEPKGVKLSQRKE